jgi:hypothetical protein
VAIRQEELFELDEAQVVAFPTARVRARAAHQARRERMLARRRRTVGALTIAGILFAGIFATGPAGSSSASDHHRAKRIVVHEGDTLWSLAERYAPEGIDPRAYVDEIVALNHLENGLAQGARIRLPK